MSPIEDFLPRVHFRELHARRIAAPPAVAAAALRGVDLRRSPFIGPLFALRGMPFAATLGELLGGPFTTLREDLPHALIVGAVGRFWGGTMQPTSPEAFASQQAPGCAKLAWLFAFEPLDGGRACRAVTETRIECCDGAARWRMQLYWWLIRPASGLIRREMLRLLARRCSDSAPPH